MTDRSRLHQLVDTLPEGAIPVAQGALERFQTWPPSEPPQIRTIRKANMARMRAAMRPGMVGGGGGGGSYRMGPGGRIEYGSESHDHWEDDTAVTVPHRFHAGHEVVIEERLRLVDRATLMYVHILTAPDGSTHRHKMSFRVEKKLRGGA